jgi:glyoxylase I family protein
MIRAVHHVALICADYQRSRHFYTAVLGFEVVREVHRTERRSYKLDLRPPGPPGPPGAAGHASVQLELFSFPDPPPRVSNPEACGLRHLAFEVADLDAAIRRLLGFGVPCEPVRTDEFTGKRFTFFRDPDDLPLELYEA